MTENALPSRDAETSAREEYIIIKGKTSDGGKFRPSDWPERLQSTLRALGEDEQSYYEGFIQIVNHEGGKCVLIDRKLESVNAILFNFFIRFAKDNRLTWESISEARWKTPH